MTGIDKYTDSSREWDKKARYTERDFWEEMSKKEI